MKRTVALAGALASLIFASCDSSLTGSGDAGDDKKDLSEGLEDKDQYPPVLSDENGMVTAAIDPNSDLAAVIRASSSSNIDGAEITFPPASFGLLTEVSIKGDDDFINTGIKRAFGMDDAEVATNTVAIAASNALTDITYDVKLPLKEAKKDRSYFASFVIKNDESAIVGVVPTEAIDVQDDHLAFSFTFDGDYQKVAFQGGHSSQEATEKKAKYLGLIEAVGALKITFGEGNSAQAVTSDLTLPTTSKHKATVSWASSDTDTVTNDGQVTRSRDDDVAVTLTATVTLNGSSLVREFEIIVKQDTSLTDEEAVDTAYDAIEITFTSGDSANDVKGNLTLASSSVYDTTVSWSSSHTNIIADDGTVTRPNGVVDAEVTLTATISRDSESRNKEFSVTVIATKLMDLYVSTAGDDSTGDGSSGNPYATIEKAVTVGTADTLIGVAAGTYTLGAAVDLADGMKIYGGFTTDFSDRSGSDRVSATYKTIIETSGTEYISCAASCEDDTVVDGFHFNVTDVSSAKAFYLDQADSDLTISNNTFDPSTGRTNDFDIIRGTDSSPTIRDNVFTKGTVTNASNRNPSLVYLDGNSSAKIQKNEMNAADIQQGYTYGIYMRETGGNDVNTALIEGNKIVAGSVLANNANSAIGIWTYDIGGGMIIRNNEFEMGTVGDSSRSSSGIYLRGDDAKVYNNLFKSSAASDGTTYGIEVQSLAGRTNNHHIYNNTILLSHEASGSFENVGILVNGSSTTPVIENNLIVLTTSGSKTGIYEKNSSAPVVANNYVYLNGAASDNYSVPGSGYSVSTTDPQIDVGDKLQLTGSTPAGVTTGGKNLYDSHAGSNVDIEGNDRPSAGMWTIGAYQVQ